MAKIPSRMLSGRSGQAATTLAKSGPPIIAPVALSVAAGDASRRLLSLLVGKPPRRRATQLQGCQVV